MADENEQQQDPSMEDILASIRRDLSEDEREEAAEAAAPEAEPALASEPEPEPASPPESSLEDVLDLTPEMIASDPVVSGPAARASADALQDLARVLPGQRDIPVGGRDVTLEGLIREILRPLLREWLDQNLPYVIERLANEEIDQKVRRAEGLDN
ncbi:MAG: DUF2497 domain-containing protein [Rhodospirillales bacterium]|nr:DUF2497 domain-containing protein [Rhodospirillales bacterium]